MGLSQKPKIVRLSTAADCRRLTYYINYS